MESVTMSGGYGTVGYEYDDLNRMTKVTYPDNKAVQYEYDKVGNRSLIKYPASLYYIYYTHDGLNRIDQVKHLAYLLADYDYDSLRRTTLTRYLSGNPAKTHYGYNDADWITSLSNELDGGSVFSSFTYAYDRAGNRRSMDRDSKLDDYDYNKRYELTGVDYDPGSSFQSQTFNYDGVGNRTSVVNGGTEVYDPNELNQYDSVGGVTHTYDLRGNLTNDGTNSYTYDLDNRLTGINGTISYEYDPFGRRIRKTVNGIVTNYVYDGDRVIEERDGSDNLLLRYVYGVGIDEVLILDEVGGGDYWYYYDALGSVVNISDNSGNLVSTIHYDVYGDFEETGSFTDNPYKFTGRRYDPESGLYFYRARMYSPSLGRFLQADSVGYIDGMNLYSYVANNPLNRLDPFGNKAGDPYGTEKLAACEALHDARERMLEAGGVLTEWGGEIYKLPDGRFSYTEPDTQGSPDSYDLRSVKEPTRVAGYHTHTTDNTLFKHPWSYLEAGQLQRLEGGEGKGLRGYLITLSGRTSRLDAPNVKSMYGFGKHIKYDICGE